MTARDHPAPAAGPVGYVLARDLGDGRVEWWEGDRDGAAVLHPTAADARAALALFGGDPDTWPVYALTEVTP